ncbi:MAG: hypothetical protein VR64_24610 [Desulfatitalea sp. BRH_c12]|nr:MAG: hypothetical protein VR64_24610 [Desulfatitalea sp. BRH_c12]
MNLNANASRSVALAKPEPFTSVRAPGLPDVTQEWQLAAERMQLYLKSMQVPPEDQLGLALEAMRRVKANGQVHKDPLPFSLEVLWQILQERSAADSACNAPQGISHLRLPASRFSDVASVAALARPAIRRQCMLSAPMELSPWRKALLDTLEVIRRPTEHLLYRRGILLGALAALILFLWLKVFSG